VLDQRRSTGAWVSPFAGRPISCAAVSRRASDFVPGGTRPQKARTDVDPSAVPTRMNAPTSGRTTRRTVGRTERATLSHHDAATAAPFAVGWETGSIQNASTPSGPHDRQIAPPCRV
jgi:hypothetical protein